MPRQIYCNACTCRKFYVMLQDDGSVEVFCETNNHKQLVVDIPTLVECIYNGKADEGPASNTGGPTEIARDKAVEVQTQAEVKPAIVLDGASRLLDR